MAKKLYHLYNETTLEIIGAAFFEEGQQPINSTLKLNPGFLSPMYNIQTDEIYEGASIEDVSIEKTPIYLERISFNVNELTTRALSSSIGKSGPRMYLESQKMIYQEKYNVAKGLSINPSMVQTITDEMNRDYPNEADLDNLLIAYGITPTGTKLEKFFDFIIFRYEYGANIYGFFISLVEDFRTCALTHVEKMQFDKAEIINCMAESLPVSITQQELIDLRANMLSV